MTLRLSRYTAPTAEPISLTEAKIHLRLATDIDSSLEYDIEDSSLSSNISAARSIAETETWKALVLQVWDLYLDEWPCGDEIRLPWPPLRKVDFIQYTESSGTVSTFADTEYEVDIDGTPGRVVLGYQKSWPSASLSPKNPIQIRFRAGYLVPFTADTTTNVLSSANHPFVDGDKVRLSVSGGDLPGALFILKDYFVRDAVTDVSFKLSTTAGGTAIDLTTAGNGAMFVGEIPATTLAGMKLILTDLHEERGDTIVGTRAQAINIPRSASLLFSMDTAKEF